MSQDQIVLDRKVKGAPPTEEYLFNRPSFFERMDSITDEALLRSPLIALVFSNTDFVQFALHHGVETDVALKVAGGYRYASAIRDGVLQRLWLWVRGFRRTGNRRPLDLANRVPIGELHAPNVQDVSVTYKLSKSFEGSMSLNVRIAGIGAGGSVTGKVTVAVEQAVYAGDCLGLVADVSGFSQEWESKKTGKKVQTIDITGVSSLAYPVKLHNLPVTNKHEHICLETNGYENLIRLIKAGGLVVGRDFESVVPEAKDYKPSIEILESHIYEATWTIPGLSDEEFGVHVTSRFDHSISATYSLVPGYRYIAVYEDVNLLPLLWLAGK